MLPPPAFPGELGTRGERCSPGQCLKKQKRVKILPYADTQANVPQNPKTEEFYSASKQMVIESEHLHVSGRISLKADGFLCEGIIKAI